MIRGIKNSWIIFDIKSHSTESGKRIKPRFLWGKHVPAQPNSSPGKNDHEKAHTANMVCYPHCNPVKNGAFGFIFYYRREFPSLFFKFVKRNWRFSFHVYIFIDIEKYNSSFTDTCRYTRSDKNTVLYLIYANVAAFVTSPIDNLKLNPENH